MCTRYPIINRVSELKVHIELTRFVQPEKIEIDANERAVNEKSPYCFFVCTTFDSFLNDFSVSKTGSCLTDSIMSYDIITMFQYILFIIYLIWVCMMDNKTYTFSISLVRYNADMFFKYNNISTLPFLYFIYICSKTYCIIIEIYF